VTAFPPLQAPSRASPVRGVLKLLPFNAVVEVLEVLARQVLPLVNLAVVPDKVLLGHLVLDALVVKVRVEHDERKGEDVGRVRV